MAPPKRPTLKERKERQEKEGKRRGWAREHDSDPRRKPRPDPSRRKEK